MPVPIPLSVTNMALRFVVSIASLAGESTGHSMYSGLESASPDALADQGYCVGPPPSPDRSPSDASVPATQAASADLRDCSAVVSPGHLVDVPHGFLMALQQLALEESVHRCQVAVECCAEWHFAHSSCILSTCLAVMAAAGSPPNTVKQLMRRPEGPPLHGGDSHAESPPHRAGSNFKDYSTAPSAVALERAAPVPSVARKAPQSASIAVSTGEFAGDPQWKQCSLAAATAERSAADFNLNHLPLPSASSLPLALPSSSFASTLESPRDCPPASAMQASPIHYLSTEAPTQALLAAESASRQEILECLHESTLQWFDLLESIGRSCIVSEARCILRPLYTAGHPLTVRASGRAGKVHRDSVQPVAPSLGFSTAECIPNALSAPVLGLVRLKQPEQHEDYYKRRRSRPCLYPAGSSVVQNKIRLSLGADSCISVSTVEPSLSPPAVTRATDDVDTTTESQASLHARVSGNGFEESGRSDVPFLDAVKRPDPLDEPVYYDVEIDDTMESSPHLRSLEPRTLVTRGSSKSQPR